MSTENEVWKAINGNAGYEVSNQGRLRHGVVIKPQSPTGKYAKIGRGYLATRINGKLLKAHRLVALAFIPNPDNLPEVNHKDGVTTNNCESNLEWTTSSQNQFHAIRTGLRIPLQGKQIGNAVLTDEIVREIRSLKEAGFSWNQIARKVGTCKRNVGRVIHGQTWRSVK